MSTKISTNKIDKLYQEFKDHIERQENILDKMVKTIEKIIDSHHDDMVKFKDILNDIVQMMGAITLLLKNGNGKNESTTPNEFKTLYS